MEVAEEKRKVACLGFVDARAMVSKDLLAIGVEAGIGGFRFAAGGVAVGGGVVPRRVAHLRRARANTERLRCSEDSTEDETDPSRCVFKLKCYRIRFVTLRFPPSLLLFYLGFGFRLNLGIIENLPCDLLSIISHLFKSI